MKHKEQKQIIKDICIEFSYTQIQLADKIGVSVGTVKQWSAGSRKIPNYFNKSIEYIRELNKLKSIH